MLLFDFIRRADARELAWIAGLTFVAGLANSFLLVIIIKVAGVVAAGARPGLWEIGVFLAGFAAYFYCDRSAMMRANELVEGLLATLRVEIADKLRRSEVQAVDSLGRGTLYSVVTQATNHLSITYPLVVESFQQAVLLIVSLLYLAYLSPAALLVFIVAMSVLALGTNGIYRDYSATIGPARQAQAHLIDAVRDVILGSKEIRLNGQRGQQIFSAVEGSSADVRMLRGKAGNDFARIIVFGMLVIYAMLGIVVFLFPQYVDAHDSLIFKLVPMLLFCASPLLKIISQTPMIAQAEAGLGAVLDIERRLGATAGVAPETARMTAQRFTNFRDIHYAGLRFAYRDAAGEPVFAVGPLNLRLTRGETLFIVGGNGGGKSTTLKLMTGLYPADAGRIEVDGAALDADGVAGLRELFSAIFVDFHLFDELYGLESVDPARVRALIAELGLAGKVNFVDGRFTDLRLSTGQRKRLALIAALLEDRPIYVFDEWAAEQDMHFRDIFYTRVLPEMKARGKTVVVVSHDERFWHVADRVVKLDLGTVLWEKSGRDCAMEDTPGHG